VNAGRAETGGEFEIVTEELLDGCLLRIVGEVDLATAPRLTEQVAREVENGGAAGALVIDLSLVPFIDSSGVRALVEADRLGRSSGRPVALYGASDAVTRVLELVEVRGRLKELSDLEPETLKALGRPQSA
jgi:anti-anti-sigma factor